MKKNSNQFKKMFFNSSWIMLEKILRLISGLIIGAWVARYLGAEKFGIISYSQSVIFILTAFVMLGIDNIFVKDIVQNKHTYGVIFGSVILIRLVLAIFMIVLVYTIINVTGNDSLSGEIIIILSFMLVFAPLNVFELYFQCKLKSNITLISNVTALLFSIFLKVYLIYNQYSIIAFAGAILFDAIIFPAMTFLFFIKYEKLEMKFSFNLSYCNALLKKGWPLVLTSLSIAIAMRIDQIMLHELVETSELGKYSVGVRVAEAMSFIPAAILASIYPKMIERKFETNIALHKKLFRYPLIMLMFISFLVSILSPYIVNILFGDEFDGSSTILSILTWSVTLSFIGSYINKLIIIEGKNRYILYRQLSILTLNVCLNLLLIPKFGIVGAAIATLLSDLVVNMFFHLIHVDLRKYSVLFLGR